MKKLTKNFLVFFAIFIIFAIILSFYSSNPFAKEEVKEVDLGTFINQVQQEQVKEVAVSDSDLAIVLNDGAKEKTRKEAGDSLSTLLKNYGIEADKAQKVQVTIKDESSFSFWVGTVLPFVLPFALIFVFIYFLMRQVQGANSRAMMFGQSGARQSDPKDKKNKITFKDVAGAKEAKEELQEVVFFLKHPKKFIDVGAKIPKGVLLMGAPGTGKTLFAKAVAGEANVPFFSISGSEFVEMFVGVGASRVRDLFKKAQKSAPCIIFIDEIDAVGRQRGSGLGGSHDEREQTLNQILVEMDGFDPNQGVIVIAATNRPDILDPALLRPGRFDRRVVIDLPDIRDREEILNVHAKEKPFAPDVNLKTIAERTPGFSGADLSNLLNEAAILTARQNRKIISMDDVLMSIEKVMLGPERKSRLISDKEKKITAYHEAGHALVAHLLPNTDPVHKISIIARGHAAGYTLKMPTEDKSFHSKTEFLEELSVFLGGFAAEQLIFGDVTTGASSDLKRATELTRKMITKFGMSSLGPITYGLRDEMIFLGREITEKSDYSEKTAERIDTELSVLIKSAHELAEKLIKENKDKLEKITKVLLEKETIERGEFEELMGKKVV